jgi:preprotein translocase subunit SecG
MFASLTSLVIFPVPMSILINLLLGIWGLVALLMMLVILMQRPKSEGLGAAFGGGVTENIFGAQTTNVLVKFTSWLAGIFFTLTFVLSILYAHRSMAESSLSRELKKSSSAPLVSPAPSAGTQNSPASSAAPDSGAGVVPAGTAMPAATSPAAGAPSPVQAGKKPAPSSPKPNGKP